MKRLAALVLVVAVIGVVTGAPAVATASGPVARAGAPVVAPTCVPPATVVGCGDGVPGLSALASLLAGLSSYVGTQLQALGTTLVGWMASSSLHGVVQLFGEIGSFVDTPTRAGLGLSALVGPAGTYHKVAAIAAVLMVALLLAGVIQGLLAGDAGRVWLSLVRDVPVAIAAMVGLPTVVGVALDIVDAWSRWVLPPGTTASRLGAVFTTAASSASLGSLPLLILALVALLGALALYVELIVRAALVVVALACAPLSLAALVWPATRSAARRAVEVLAALVLSKLVIAIALSTGLDLTEAWTRRGVLAASGWGPLVTGTAVVILACFAPFVLIRLMPAVETAVIAQGLSRAPARSARTAAAGGADLAAWMQTPTMPAVDRVAGPAGPSAVVGATDTVGEAVGGPGAGLVDAVVRPHWGAPVELPERGHDQEES